MTDDAAPLLHIRWIGDALVLLDQRRLPGKQVHVVCRDVAAVCTAIRDMVVRGAPAIGITAAYGAVLAAQASVAQGEHWRRAFAAQLDELGTSRPTAVNLRWALRRIAECADACEPPSLVSAVEAEAIRIHEQDVECNRRMAAHGAALIEPGCDVITHCNAGTLATGGIGTALGVIRRGVDEGRIAAVYAGETRPWLQGSRLTAWELAREGIDVTLICEAGVGALMRERRPGWVIVGADRIAANGDVANKIGTYNLAVLARQHGVRMMVAAPTSTIDRESHSGADIPVEERDGAEILAAAGYHDTPPHVHAWNPVFDVTPAALIDAIVTEAGVASPPSAATLSALFDSETT